LVLILISTFGVLLSLSLFRKNRQPDPETNINIEQSRELNPPIASPPLPDPPNFDTNKELSQTINQTAQKALTALTNGDYAQAIALFRTVIALQPEHQSARQNLILALCLDQNPQEAITEIKLALENGVPISPKLQILLGFSNYQLEKYAEANEAFQAAYEQDKQRLELLAYTGFALQLTENTESATMQYQEFLRLLSERYHSHPAPQKLIALATLVQEILNGENTPPQSLQEWIIEDFTTWKEFLLENVEQ
jgi:tetratricopeptide (TPR) repeat protein